MKFDGGVIYIIDKVLEVPSADSATAVAVGLTYLADRLLHGYPWVPPEEGGPDPWVGRVA
jgi:hypothetical protein